MPENLEHYVSVFVTYMHIASRKTLLLFLKYISQKKITMVS